MNLMRRYYGKNICFYYYGEDHMVVNLFKYIKQNIENNILIYMNINSTVYSMLNSNLDNNEKRMIRPIDIEKDLGGFHNIGGSKIKPNISEAIATLKKEALAEGFWGISLIVDASLILSKTCPSIYEDYLKAFSISSEKSKLNILTCYDFVDYISRGKIISEDIMKLSYKYHSYRMFGNEIIPVENFILNDAVVSKSN